jgi:amino acid adenylation domain-containing protein
MSTAESVSQSPEFRHLHQIFKAWAELTPEAIAIAAPGRAPLTYRRLFAQVETVKKSLNAAGIGRNDRVAVALPDGPETAVAFLAVAAAASCVPLNPAFRAGEMTSYMAHLGAKALIAPAETDSHARTVARALGIPVLELSALPRAEAGLFKLSGAANARETRSGFAAPDDVALMLYTSGTTSNPKLVPLTQANLCASARNIRAALELTQADRCLNVMPLFHIHGLIGAVLSSLAAGGSVFCTPGFYAPQFFQWLDEFRPTWYTAVPTMNQSILVRAAANRAIIARPELRFIRSCSAPLPARLASELETTFAVPVIDSYGMTEACHQIASTPPAKRKPGSVGVAAGPEIAIINKTGGRLPAGIDGEIAIRGANVMRGYEGTPEINRQAFTGGWFRTGDLGHIDGEGYLFITGRLKEIINRAGEKISPGEVEEALLAHPAVKEAVVFAMPHPELGEEIAAAAVLHDGAKVSDSELRRFAAERLADFKVPTRVVFVAAIPAGATGKVERLKLAEQLALLPESIDVMADYVSPRAPLENQLADLWSEVLGVARVGIHDNFFALGGDSILAAQLLSRIRARLNAEISFVSFFDAPTIAGIAALLQSAPRPAAALDGIARSQDGAAPPLSYAQERMWFLDQLVPGNPAYNRPTGYRLHGPLDAAVLERCLGEIVERHEVLRTTFSSRDGLPFQVVSRDPSLSFEIVDLKELPGARRRMESERLAAAEAQRPFDLAKGPLLRATLIALHETEHILLLVTHHIVFDGWSEAIFLRELTTLYEAFARGEPSPLPALPTQYVDYAVWHRRRLHGGIFADQLSYWKRQLSGAAVLDLPTDRPRPAVQTFRGAKKFAALPKNLVAELKALSRREGATLFMTLLAAFQTLLHRYTGQNDIVVGSPIAGRTLPEIEGLIGVFINTLVFRGDLSGNPKFTELMARTRKTALDAYERQDLPFEKLVKELRPERDPSRTPLFQVMFVFENTPHAELDFPGLTASRFELDGGTAKLDLSVSVEETAGSLNAIFEYNTDLFGHDTISRMLGHFETLLQSIAANPEERLSDLPLLTEIERRQLLMQWNDTKREYPRDKCLHELFEAQVERTPDATALVFEDQQLTYRDLNRRANQVAHHLRKLGVKPDGLVGLYMERSLEMVVGLLGILKAGGAYVPLDSAYPKKLLAFMLAETQVALLLTRRALADVFPEFQGQVLRLDRDESKYAGEEEKNPQPAAGPDNLAYIMYTSGSTGRPKGVLIRHAGVVDYFFYLRETYNLNDGDTVLQLPPISFDASVRDLFGPLTAGARVVLVNDFDARAPSALLSEIRKRRVTCLLSVVPTMLNALLEAARDRPRVDTMRLILVSGEALSMSSCLKAKEVFGHDVGIVNQYGPTETTLTCSYHRVVDDDSDRDIAPLGKPIPTARIYILERDLQIVPTGVAGELHIGGDGLARGYLNSPDLTAEKFIPDPFSDEPGARLYKTGDLARYLPDDNIEFLGRLDNQIKIRGFRVEPGEIEAALCLHPGVRESVVVAREDPSTSLRAGVENPKSEIQNPKSGGRRLVAYVVPTGTQVPAAELRDFLKSRLPDYMVPSAFVALAALPLTPNGKIDRRALPAPDRSRPELKNTFVAPRNALETTLAAIWAQVIGIEQVGVHDNFFDLGGHSLLATQVISRVREAHRVEVNLRTFFERPTVAGIAEVIERAKDGDAENPTPKIPRVSRRSQP